MANYEHWDDVPTHYSACSHKGSNVDKIIAAGDTIDDAKRIAWETLGGEGCEIAIHELSGGSYKIVSSRFPDAN